MERLIKLMGTRVNNEKTWYEVLCEACSHGHASIVENLLLSDGLKQRAKPLSLAVLHEHSCTIKVLLEKRVGLPGLSKALITAISNDDAFSIELLVKHNAKKEDVAVVRALRNGTPSTALKLVTFGYDVKGRYLEKRRTALHYATEKGFTDVVNAVIERGAEVNIYDRNHNIPLHLAAIGGHDAIIAVLLKNGADPKAMDRTQQALRDRNFLA